MESDNSVKRKVHLKVVIIGAVNVGKTTFVQRYLEGQFKDHTNKQELTLSIPIRHIVFDTHLTLGASFSLKQWGQYSIAIWDTAGEERFRGLSNFYCRGAGAAIVAFDLTDEDSFHALRAIYVPLLESALEDCIKIVIGTKSDLIPSRSRGVSVEDAEVLAREINPPHVHGQKLFYETSSLKGLNIEAVFEQAFKLSEPEMKKQLGGDMLTDSVMVTAKKPVDSQPKSNCAC